MDQTPYAEHHCQVSAPGPCWRTDRGLTEFTCIEVTPPWSNVPSCHLGRIGDDALRVDLIRITQDNPLVVVVRWSGGSQSRASPPRSLTSAPTPVGSWLLPVRHWRDADL